MKTTGGMQHGTVSLTLRPAPTEKAGPSPICLSTLHVEHSSPTIKPKLQSNQQRCSGDNSPKECKWGLKACLQQIQEQQNHNQVLNLFLHNIEGSETSAQKTLLLWCPLSPTGNICLLGTSSDAL
eukprot:550029-Amphidinium_carterae.1